MTQDATAHLISLTHPHDPFPKYSVRHANNKKLEYGLIETGENCTFFAVPYSMDSDQGREFDHLIEAVNWLKIVRFQ